MIDQIVVDRDRLDAFMTRERGRCPASARAGRPPAEEGRRASVDRAARAHRQAAYSAAIGAAARALAAALSSAISVLARAIGFTGRNR
jgi:hypothetical protein